MYSKKAIHESRYLRQARRIRQYVDLPRIQRQLLPHVNSFRKILSYNVNKVNH